MQKSYHKLVKSLFQDRSDYAENTTVLHNELHNYTEMYLKQYRIALYSSIDSELIVYLVEDSKCVKNRLNAILNAVGYSLKTIRREVHIINPSKGANRIIGVGQSFMIRNCKVFDEWRN